MITSGPSCSNSRLLEAIEIVLNQYMYSRIDYESRSEIAVAIMQRQRHDTMIRERTTRATSGGLLMLLHPALLRFSPFIHELSNLYITN